MGEDRDLGSSYKGEDTASSVLICPECGEENAAGAVICAACHIALAGTGKRKRQSARRARRSGSERSLEAAETLSRKRHPSVRARRLIDEEYDSAESMQEATQFLEEDTEASSAEKVRAGRSRRTPGAGVSKHAAPETRRKPRFRSLRSSAEEDAILWEGRLSKAQRLRQWVPESFFLWVRKAAKKADTRVILATGTALVLIATLVVGFSLRPRQRQDTAEGLGLSFELSERWQDVTTSREWPGYFVVASKILNLGASPSLVLLKDKTALAILSREPATDTTPAEAASSDVEDVGLVYSLSSDTRLYGREDVDLFGVPATGFVAERWVASEYYNEEVIVTALGDRVVYVVFTAPQSRWESESQEVWKILRSAKLAAD